MAPPERVAEWDGVNLRPSLPSFPQVGESRKLTGLAIGIIAEIGNAILGAVLHWAVAAPSELFISAATAITGIVGFHQAAQGASDRAKWQSGPGGNRPPDPPL